MSKDREDLINQIKNNLGDPSDEDIRRIEDLKENYKDKSDDEIYMEVIEINKNMKEKMSPDEYENIFSKLEKIKPLLNKEQKSKLEGIMNRLGKKW